MKFTCVGRNYVKHIEEMNAVKTKNPVIFLKPETAYTTADEIFIPDKLGELHYEVELCLEISKRLKDVTKEEARDSISRFTIGLDMTLRGMQSELKRNGLPWDLSKGFDNEAIMSKWMDIKGNDITNMDIYLYKNDKRMQYSNTSLMTFSPYFIISYVSRFMTIEEGDVIMTGTPEGVGAVFDGDILRFGIKGMDEVEKIIRIRR